MSELRIAGVETHMTQPAGSRLIVVKVLTNQDGLYGLGCATFAHRHLAVAEAIDKHVGPFVIGRNPHAITDIFHSEMVNGYWRNGPVLNNAISGIDMALWDIKGKLAGLPCFQLWGGACRAAVPVYTHTGGKALDEAVENASKGKEQGYRYIRCQLGGYHGQEIEPWPQNAPKGRYGQPRAKLTQIPELFARIREQLGEEIELLYDVHERLAPIDAVWLAKALEPYRLFFLEDLLAPEDLQWFEQVRAVCATPLAMGELFNNPNEIIPLVSKRQIDFVRCHVSQIGGATPALQLAHFCEPFGVRTAWHGAGDLSGVGVMANIHLSLACHNFGIQEWTHRADLEYEMFPGLPQVEDGLVYANNEPGWGVDFDADLASRFPCSTDNPTWTHVRLPDGTSVRP